MKQEFIIKPESVLDKVNQSKRTKSIKLPEEIIPKQQNLEKQNMKAVG